MTTMDTIILVDPQQIIRGGSFHQSSTNSTVTSNHDDAEFDLSGGEEPLRDSDSDDSGSDYEEEEEETDEPSVKRVKVKDEDDITITENHPIWSSYEPRSVQQKTKFQKPTEAQPIEISSNEEIEFYRLLLDDEILDILVDQTNIYAQQTIDKTKATKQLMPHSRLNNWQPTTREEMLCFLGILIWMGLDKKPGINEYWKNMDIYRSKAADYMSRNRFELLIRFFHFSNNAICPVNTASYKIQPVLDALNDRFMKYVDIDEKVYLNEYSLRAKLIGKTPGEKTRDFRTKYRTLTMLGGYSYYTKVYTNTRKRTDYREIVEFVSPILNRGVTLYTGEAITSVALATVLRNKDTNLVGPIDREIADLPEEILHSDVSKTEMAARERDGMIVLKWEVKRNQSKIFLTTRHGKESVQIRTNSRRERPKPKSYQEYLKVVEDNSLSKMEEYCPNRRGDKWFKKIGLQVLVVQCVFNAYCLMIKKNPKRNYNSTNFRENLCLQLLTKYGTLTQAARHTFLPTSKKISPSSLTHVYIAAGRKGVCFICDVKNKEGKKNIRNVKTSSYKCSGCLDKSFMCMDCFFEAHTAILK